VPAAAGSAPPGSCGTLLRMKRIGVVAAVVVALGLALGAAARAEERCGPAAIASSIEPQQQATLAKCTAEAKALGKWEALTSDATIVMQVSWTAAGSVAATNVVSVTGGGNGEVTAGLRECVTGKVRSWNLVCGPATREVPFLFKSTHRKAP